MRIRSQVVVLTAVMTVTLSAHAASIAAGTLPTQGVETVGWNDEHFTQSAPGFVRPPPNRILREARIAETDEHRHPRHGERRVPGDKSPAHPEEIRMPAP